MKHKMAVVLRIFLFNVLSTMAQKPVDEEKVKKAIALMQKMMCDPNQAPNVIMEMQALKLSSAEISRPTKHSSSLH